MGDLRGPRDVERRAQHVRDMSECHELVVRPDHGRHRVEVDLAVGRERNDVDGRTGPLGYELPGNDVRVMLEGREQDAVAGLEVRAAPAVRDQIDALGRAAHEDDLARRCGIDEARDAGARGLEGDRHVGRAGIDAAMHGRIIGAHGAGGRIDDGLRFLCGRGGVEIMPGAPSAVTRPGKSRLIAEKPSRVERSRDTSVLALLDVARSERKR